MGVGCWGLAPEFQGLVGVHPQAWVASGVQWMRLSPCTGDSDNWWFSFSSPSNRKRWPQKQTHGTYWEPCSLCRGSPCLPFHVAFGGLETPGSCGYSKWPWINTNGTILG